MGQRSFRSIVVPVSGHAAHDALTARAARLPDVVVRRSTLQRTGARRRRRLDAPTYESRIVVELEGAATLGEGPSRPYRGVSQSDLDALVAEVGGHQRMVLSASLSFIAESRSRRPCERLAAELEGLADTHALRWSASMVERDSEMLPGHELHARATGAPLGVAIMLDTLQESPWATWKMRARWFTKAARR